MKNHKFIISILFVTVIISSYFCYTKFFKTKDVVRYATAQIQKGELIISVSGSGQVSASNQTDIKPKVSGNIASVAIKDGQEIKQGTIIAQIDSKDAQRTIEDNEINLESAKLALKKLLEPPDVLALLQTENALNQAKRDLKDLLEPPDALALLQTENALSQAKESKQKAEDDLIKQYDDGFNTIANAFLNLPTIMTGLEDILFEESFVNNQWNISWYYSISQIGYQNNESEKANQYYNDVYNAYNEARSVYTKNFDDYRATSRAIANQKTIESLLLQTYETTKKIADAIKISNNYIDFAQDVMTQHDFQIPSMVATHQSALDSYTGTTNNHLLNLLSIKRAIQTDKETIINADRDIIEKTESLDKLKAGSDIEIIQTAQEKIKEREKSLDKLKAGVDAEIIQTAQEKIKEREKSLDKLKAGADALDIQSAELTIKQRENSLFDAQEKLADYSVKALFDGVISNIDIQKGDSVSSTNILATLTTRQKIAEISLNEIDVAKVKTGQKATLTFDAVPNLTITGQVVELDAIGIVSQGVVTYTVKISFDMQDDRVKTAMSVSAAIIIDAKLNTLLAPNSAIKSQNKKSYVEIVEGDDKNSTLTTNPNGIILKNVPVKQQIKIGITNDEFTEIINGLNEGDVIITRTIQPTTAQKTTQTQQNSSFRIPGVNTGGVNRR